MRQIIINADDFGLSPAINLGIIDAHKNGVLSSATLMANMPGFESAVDLAKDNPDLGVGVHLVLTAGAPITMPYSLINERGSFRNLSFYEEQFVVDEDELYQEWKAQIEKIIRAGITPSHLDSHHHVHTIDGITNTVIRLGREYGLPIRNNTYLPEDILKTEKFIPDFDSLAHTKNIWQKFMFKNILDDLKMYKTVELMCHPGYIDDICCKFSSLVLDRVYTCGELKKPEYKEMLLNNDIQLINFHQIRNSKIK